MDKETPVPEWLRRVRQEEGKFEAMSCSELLAYLDHHWGELWEGRRVYLTSLAVDKNCQKGVPYLLRQLESTDPSHRWRALSGLKQLGRREYRQVFVNFHLNDSDDDVRQIALIDLCDMFRGERDIEILQLALDAFDDPASSVGMRLAAGAAMMYQLNVPDELGEPMWWNEEEEDLQHPALLWAVVETRQLLATEASE